MEILKKYKNYQKNEKSCWALRQAQGPHAQGPQAQ